MLILNLVWVCSSYFYKNIFSKCLDVLPHTQPCRHGGVIVEILSPSVVE